MDNAGLWSIIPPLVGIALALITREIVLSLFAAIFSGAIIHICFVGGDFIVGNLAPAEASALAIENGEVRLTVEVDASADLKTWKPATTVEIDVPVEGEKGYYILKSK